MYNEREINRGKSAIECLQEESPEWAEKLMGRVNFSDKESLMYFERSLIRGGIIDRLREAGCEEGDTVNFCGIAGTLEPWQSVLYWHI